MLDLRRRLQLPTPARLGDVALSMEGIGVRYGSTSVLDGASFEVRAGEMVALVGPNGAGKSTLMSVAAGDIHPNAGQVHIDGSPISSWSTGDLALRRAVLPQQHRVSFAFSVREVVQMGRDPWRATELEDLDDGVVAWALHATDMEHLAHREFAALSGGEQARCALARVLAQRAGVLLLDEPTASLDIRHQEQVMQIARSRAVAGDAVVVVLHDLGTAAAHADRVVIMHAGTVVADGPPSSAMTESLLAEVYGCPIEILHHPRTGAPLVVPRREVALHVDA